MTDLPAVINAIRESVAAADAAMVPAGNGVPRATCGHARESWTTATPKANGRIMMSIARRLAALTFVLAAIGGPATAQSITYEVFAVVNGTRVESQFVHEDGVWTQSIGGTVVAVFQERSRADGRITMFSGVANLWVMLEPAADGTMVAYSAAGAANEAPTAWAPLAP